MTTQTLQQTLTKVWHTRASRLVAVSLSLVLLAISVVAYQRSSVPAGLGRTTSQRTTIAQAHPASPALRTSGSAYDGQSHQGAQAAASRATHNTPIRTAASSAYDGQTYLAVRPATRNYPLRTAASSAYDGQSYRSAAPAVRVASPGTPIQSAASSAYDGQHFRTQAPQPRQLVPALMGTGSAYDGQ
jgi:hypothetical protein